MIKYSILTAPKADSDGEWAICLVVHEQDPKTIPVRQMWASVFTASNGWTVKSNKWVQIEPEDKTIWLLGSAWTETVLGLMQANIGNHYCKTLNEMLEVKAAINVAISDWVKAGGFKIEYETETYDL